MKFADLLHGTPEQMLQHLEAGELTPAELQAALTNITTMVRNMRDSLGAHLMQHLKQSKPKQ